MADVHYKPTKRTGYPTYKKNILEAVFKGSRIGRGRGRVTGGAKRKRGEADAGDAGADDEDAAAAAAARPPPDAGMHDEDDDDDDDDDEAREARRWVEYDEEQAKAAARWEADEDARVAAVRARVPQLQAELAVLRNQFRGLVDEAKELRSRAIAEFLPTHVLHERNQDFNGRRAAAVARITALEDELDRALLGEQPRLLATGHPGYWTFLNGRSKESNLLRERLQERGVDDYWDEIAKPSLIEDDDPEADEDQPGFVAEALARQRTLRNMKHVERLMQSRHDRMMRDEGNEREVLASQGIRRQKPPFTGSTKLADQAREEARLINRNHYNAHMPDRVETTGVVWDPHGRIAELSRAAPREDYRSPAQFASDAKAGFVASSRLSQDFRDRRPDAAKRAGDGPRRGPLPQHLADHIASFLVGRGGGGGGGGKKKRGGAATESRRRR